MNNNKNQSENIRLSYHQNPANGSLEILEENHYNPFGLKHAGYANNNLQTENKYKYNGKELQSELGLNIYEYGARNYDPAMVDGLIWIRLRRNTADGLLILMQ
ncbi:hypothetical protein [Apibacter adventoris]|uniref:hypothetical protein n=1 Tax=Apibacter adventoris TaxID=1679466 RepID=UPI0015E4428C|nr:hypothetical protein [Apibacter adventoris]